MKTVTTALMPIGGRKNSIHHCFCLTAVIFNHGAIAHWCAPDGPPVLGSLREGNILVKPLGNVSLPLTAWCAMSMVPNLMVCLDNFHALPFMMALLHLQLPTAVCSAEFQMQRSNGGGKGEGLISLRLSQ